MSLATFLEHHMLPCPSRVLLHMECPGCGMQRSLVCLLHGDVRGSLALHPAIIPLLALVMVAGLHLVFKFSKGAKIIIALQAIVAIIVIAFYIYKITQQNIF